MQKAVAASVGLVFVLAGCGGGGAGTTTAVPLSALPVRDTSSNDTLIYVSSVENDVYVYAYPSRKSVQTLTGFNWLHNICSDSNGNVWIADAKYESSRSGYLIEYAHGGTTPVATLDDADLPEACAVDPATGNLAAVNSNGSVAVYKNAKGTPTYYSGGSLYGFFTASYDSTSDLFFSGYLGNFKVGTGWLEKGTSSLSSFRLKPHIFPHVGLAWDGRHLVVAANTTYIYQYAIKGTYGKKVGKLSLDISRMENFAIEGELLVAIDSGTVDIFQYPSGKLINAITGVDNANGITISVPPSR